MKKLELDRTMSQLRRLTEKGIAEFTRFLDESGRGHNPNAPSWLLYDRLHSVPLQFGDVEIEQRGFETRGEFARYLDQQMLEAGVTVDADEPGLWEWLSLFYFDAVCPKKRGGGRYVGDLPRHVRRQRGWHYRHLLRESYMLHRLHGSSHGNPAELLLCRPVYDHGTVFEHLCARPRLRNSTSVLTVARMLYFDTTKGVPKRGATVGNASIQKFGMNLRNLSAELDLSAVSVETILALLPSEFDGWITDPDTLEDLKQTRELFNMRSDVGPSHDALDIADVLQSVETRRLSRSQRLVRSDRFRVGVLHAYDTTCAVSGVGLMHKMSDRDTHYEVQAAHIIPVSRGGTDIVQNGLALSRTIHWAFDEGIIWIDSDLRVKVSSEVHRDRRNEFLRGFAGRPLRLPRSEKLRPHIDAVNWHAKNIAGIDE